MRQISPAFLQSRPSPWKGRAAIALVEVVVATGLVLTIAVLVTHLLMVSTRVASANRVLTAARAIVQRNIDNALAVRWTSTAAVPAVLATTSGSVYDDDGANLNGEGTNKIALVIERKADGTPYTVIPATLDRIVTDISPSAGATIRQVKFRLTYTFQNRSQTVEMSTMRAIDD